MHYGFRMSGTNAFTVMWLSNKIWLRLILTFVNECGILIIILYIEFNNYCSLVEQVLSGIIYYKYYINNIISFSIICRPLEQRVYFGLLHI